MSDDRESVEVFSIRRCPMCVGALEGGLLDAPRGLDLYAHMCAETLVSPWHWKMPGLQALRCRNCELVIFLYGRNQGMNEKPDSGKAWHRVARYAIVTAVIQTLLGIMLYSTMYGRGPTSLLFLIPMVNIAYPWLMQNAVSFQLWPAAIVIGTFFLFIVILVIGETANWLRKQVFGSERRHKSHE